MKISKYGIIAVPAKIYYGKLVLILDYLQTKKINLYGVMTFIIIIIQK